MWAHVKKFFWKNETFVIFFGDDLIMIDSDNGCVKSPLKICFEKRALNVTKEWYTPRGDKWMILSN